MNGSFELQENLGIFCLYDDVEVPSLATEKSACFDLKAHLKSHTKVLAYNPYNHKKEILIQNNSLSMLPHWRYLIPTGIIFDIPRARAASICPLSIILYAPRKTSVEYAADIIPTLIVPMVKA